MSIAKDAALLLKPKSIFKIFSRPKIRAHFCFSETMQKLVVCFWDCNKTPHNQEQELSDWVGEQIAAGFKVYYKNKNGRNVRL